MMIAQRLESLITPATWLIAMRRDAWLTLMLQVDDGREPLRTFKGVPITVLDIEEEFIVCGT